jgi:hypothetical protein
MGDPSVIAAIEKQLFKWIQKLLRFRLASLTKWCGL